MHFTNDYPFFVERIPVRQISIDIETYSSTNLNQTGVYRYADSDDFELLLFAMPLILDQLLSLT